MMDGSSISPRNTQVRYLGIIIAVVWLACTQVDARAQQPGPPAASPYQQRLSPYLDLLRADNSALSPYHSFLQPRREFNRRLRWQSNRIGQLEQNAMGFRSVPRSSLSSRMPTGRGGRFHTYLHFYPTQNQSPTR